MVTGESYYVNSYYFTYYFCMNCDSSCATCSDVTYLNCLTCASGYLYFLNYGRCFPYYVCPNGYYLSGSSCQTTSTNLIFSVIFNTTQSTFYDTVGGIPLQSGAIPNLYPHYSSNNVRSTQGRGIYFTTTSYLTIDGESPSRLVLAPEFTIVFWILIFNDGIFFTRTESSAVYISMSSKESNYMYWYIKQLASSLTCDNPATQYYRGWHFMRFIKRLDYDQEELLISIDGISYYTLGNYGAYYLDPINSVTTRLGDSTSGFQGYIWSIDIYSRPMYLLYNQNIFGVYPIYRTKAIEICRCN